MIFESQVLSITVLETLDESLFVAQVQANVRTRDESHPDVSFCLNVKMHKSDTERLEGEGCWIAVKFKLGGH